MAYNSLTAQEKEIIAGKGTEPAFSGDYIGDRSPKSEGVFLCRRCNAPLYRTADKFNSGCGWPSFDDEIDGAVKRVPDADGRRTEIVCMHCDGHLGHVFEGENFTEKDTRHCVNSLSIRFYPDGEEIPAIRDPE